jgi:uroporphyrinogen decarboxylase
LGDGTLGQIVGHPIDTWDKMSRYTIHSVHDYYDRVMRELQDVPPDKYIYGDLGTALYCVASLRGLVNFFEDIYLHRRSLEELIRKVTDFRVSQVEIYARTGRVHCVAAYDDWAMQSGLMISPEVWVELLKPAYARICAAAKESGMHAYIHMCGNPSSITDELIDAGFDILNFEQARLMGIERLGGKYAGKVAFCLPVDNQVTIASGDKDRIEAEVKLLLHFFNTPRGGFIAKKYGQWEGDSEFDPHEYALQMFLKYGAHGQDQTQQP